MSDVLISFLAWAIMFAVVAAVVWGAILVGQLVYDYLGMGWLGLYIFLGAYAMGRIDQWSRQRRLNKRAAGR